MLKEGQQNTKDIFLYPSSLNLCEAARREQQECTNEYMTVVNDEANKAKIQNAMGIIGGTFDPAHLGHLHLAAAALREIEFATIRFIPCFIQAHGKTISATAEERLVMLNLALANDPKFSVDDREIKRQGVSYMIDTLKSLREEMPTMPLCLIMGVDAFAKFNTWRRWREIIDLAHLVVADRPDFSLANLALELQELIKNKQVQKKEILNINLAGSIYFIKIKPLPIAAHVIRDLIKSGKSVEHLLPEKVWQYILQSNLYR